MSTFFVDLEEAFDKVTRILWRTMERRGTIERIKKPYEETENFKDKRH